MPQIPLPDLQTIPITTLTPVGYVLLFLAAAIVVSLFSRRIARLILSLRRVTPGKNRMSQERVETLIGLIGSMVTLIAFIGAILTSFSRFVEASTLIWIVGLFSAAFGLGARALVADVLAGGRFIFHNTFAIGEKVELNVAGALVEGIVESVNVTNTVLRAPSGEMFVVPNGDIGVIRNFSRAPYSSIRLRFKIPTEQLPRALSVLQDLDASVGETLPQIDGPWQVLSTNDLMGQHVELTIMAHSEFGKAASLRLQLGDVVYQALQKAGVTLVD
jgi:small conductance mechanosensitive channel